MSASSPPAGQATPGGFVPPRYPYERLGELRAVADAWEGGVVDLSVGTPCDPPPAAVVSSLASSGAERGYPASVGSAALRRAASEWMAARFGVAVTPAEVLACVGTKEMVASLPHWLALRSPARDTVLHPALAYPTYAMGAVLAGCRAVAVPLQSDGSGRMDLSAVAEEDAARALVLWVNSPCNPTGALDDLEAAASWGRVHGVVVASDECYAAFTWHGPGRTILDHRLDGVLALHSLSKRSNLAGLRVGFCAGDPELVHYLAEVRKHAGLMVPGPVQAAAAVALGDEIHVTAQRARYRERLDYFAKVLTGMGIEVALPAGGFYLWAKVPDPPDEGAGGTHAWAWAARLARLGGVLVSPGDLYGPDGAAHLRVAMVAPMERLEMVAGRLGRGRQFNRR